MQQVVFQSVQVRVRTVTLRVVHAALTPAVSVLANKLALGFTADVVKSSLNEAALQVTWKDYLEACGGEKHVENGLKRNKETGNYYDCPTNIKG